MRQMLLTGVGNEENFTNGTGSVFYLIFNGGELRVPVSEEAVGLVVSHMLSEEEVERRIADTRPPPPVGKPAAPPEPESEVTEDDGVDQV